MRASKAAPLGIDAPGRYIISPALEKSMAAEYLRNLFMIYGFATGS
ncbi:MAG: hypothetical protein HY790_07805 [Deltaproteobacteria bacterium]|nr:hypothetical protein [Deltaproteobacteria bacterium]